MKRWVVEMTIDGSVRPVFVLAASDESAKNAAEQAHPEATRIYNVYTVARWRRICADVRATPDVCASVDGGGYIFGVDPSSEVPSEPRAKYLTSSSPWGVR